MSSRTSRQREKTNNRQRPTEARFRILRRPEQLQDMAFDFMCVSARMYRGGLPVMLLEGGMG
jgi:hypothetical protein